MPAELRGTPQGVVASGDSSAVRVLLDGGTRPDVRDEQGRTLLHVAAIHGRRDVAALLLDRGAQGDARDDSGMTPLHGAAYGIHWIPPGEDRGMRLFAACGSEHADVARMLIEKGADVRARDDRKGTPLHSAAEGGNLGVARILVERGAVIDARDEFDATPLHRAAEGGNHEPGLLQFVIKGDHLGVAKYLVERGADPNVRSLVGTPIVVATRCGASEIASFLLGAGASSTTRDEALRAAAFQGDAVLLTSLLDKGAALEARDSGGRTALLWAALGGRDATVRVLLARGARIDVTDAAGATPGHEAARSGDVATLLLLLERGSDVRAIDAGGNTLLHAAAAGCRAGERMLAFLLERGLDVNARNAATRTPLYLALEADCLVGSPIEEALRSHGAKR